MSSQGNYNNADSNSSPFTGGFISTWNLHITAFDTLSCMCVFSNMKKIVCILGCPMNTRKASQREKLSRKFAAEFGLADLLC